MTINKHQPHAMVGEVISERLVPGNASAHAGERGVLVELPNGRKAWGFGADRVAAEVAAIGKAQSIAPPEDPDDDTRLSVESWSGASISDLPIKALGDWGYVQLTLLDASFLKSTVPVEYAGVIEDAPVNITPHRYQDFKQQTLAILAIDDAGQALVHESVFYNDQNALIDTLVVLPASEAMAKADRYRMNARIQCLAARGHDNSEAGLPKMGHAFDREEEQIERNALGIDDATVRHGPARDVFTPSDGQIRCAQALLVAKAHEAMLRPIVEGYQRDILTKHQFKPAAEWVDGAGVEGGVITEGKHTYLLAAADFQVYLEACQLAREAHGLKVEKPENCPLLEAQDVRIQCENALLKAWEGHPRLSTLADAGTLLMEERAQVIDLTLGLLAPYVKDNAHDMLADLGIHPPAPKAPAHENGPEL